MLRPFLAFFLWLVTSKPFLLSQQYTSEASDLAIRCLQASQAVVASLPEGKMSFHVKSALSSQPQSKIQIVGSIYWNFPQIRIEYEQLTSSEDEKPPSRSRFIVVDSNKGVSTHSIDTGQVFHSPEHARRADPLLRLAPWQCWFEFFGEVKLEDVLDLAVFSSRAPNHRFETRSDRFVILGGGIESSIIFDRERSLVKQFDFDTHEGEFEWIQIGDAIFPRLIRYQPKSEGAPMVLIETFGHSTVHGIDESLFHASSFDLSSVSKIITYRKGLAPQIQKLKPPINDSMRDVIKKLGVGARSSGFSKGAR